MKNKTTRTHSISDDLYIEFLDIIKKENINKSKLIESLIKEFIDKYKSKMV